MKTSPWFHRLLASTVIAATSACPSTPPAPETAEELRTRLMTVDGDGSGLDADLLDGRSSADFSYAAGDGLGASGNTFAVDYGAVQRRVTGACAAGTFATAVGGDGALACDAPPPGPAVPAARQIVVVPAAGTAAQNGAALRSAVAAARAVPSKPWVISLDAGDFDVGAQSLALGANTHLVGAGIAATRILGQGSGAALAGVVSAGNGTGPILAPEIRALTIRCTGAVNCSALELSYAAPELRDVGLEVELTAGNAYGVHGSYISGIWRNVRMLITSDGAGSTVAGVWAGRFQPDVLDLKLTASNFAGSTVIGMHLEEASVPDIRQATVVASGQSSINPIAVRVAMGALRLYDSQVFGYDGAAVSVASGSSATIVNSKLAGPRVGPGTLRCLGAFDELYDPIGSGC